MFWQKNNRGLSRAIAGCTAAALTAGALTAGAVPAASAASVASAASAEDYEYAPDSAPAPTWEEIDAPHVAIIELDAFVLDRGRTDNFVSGKVHNMGYIDSTFTAELNIGDRTLEKTVDLGPRESVTVTFAVEPEDFAEVPVGGRQWASLTAWYENDATSYDAFYLPVVGNPAGSESVTPNITDEAGTQGNSESEGSESSDGSSEAARIIVIVLAVLGAVGMLLSLIGPAAFGLFN